MFVCELDMRELSKRRRNQQRDVLVAAVHTCRRCSGPARRDARGCAVGSHLWPEAVHRRFSVSVDARAEAGLQR